AAPGLPRQITAAPATTASRVNDVIIRAPSNNDDSLMRFTQGQSHNQGGNVCFRIARVVYGLSVFISVHQRFH
ncbi:MAG: hypothetical protein WCK47_10280, partial [bacterium]